MTRTVLPLALLTLLAAAPPRHPSPGEGRSPLEQAREARHLEELGAYDRAAQVLRALRRRVPEDADLELFLALDEARSGQRDSAAARLSSAVIDRAAADSLPLSRRREYEWERESAWVNGRFDGWHWYVSRARAELALELASQLSEVLARERAASAALEAARQCVAARGMSGKDWLLLALCADLAGSSQEARGAAMRAVALDPILPEAHYVAGLWAWREGRRAEAQERFRGAVELDSSYREPALALVRCRLPGATPDPMPRTPLVGVRRAALLTSPDRPKLEEFVQMDVSATLLERHDSASDSLRGGAKPVQLLVSVLVDERGRVAANDIPWFTPAQLSEAKVSRALATLPHWRFGPAQKLGEPQRVWAAVEFILDP